MGRDKHFYAQSKLGLTRLARYLSFFVLPDSNKSFYLGDVQISIAVVLFLFMCSLSAPIVFTSVLSDYSKRSFGHRNE